MLYLKVTASLAILFAALSTCARAAVVVETGYIGCHKLTLKAQSAVPSVTFNVPGSTDYLAITELYPDTPDRVEYQYKVMAKGIGTYERHHLSTGFGPVTYFVRVRSKPVGPVKISGVAGAAGRPPLISAVWGVTKKELDALLAKDRFSLMGLIPWGKPEEQEQFVGMLARSIAGKPELGIGGGFSREITYAAHDAKTVRDQIQACRDWARKYKLQAALGLVSWWGGTPSSVPDGLGGKFGDIKYQQVCYSPDAEVRENAALKSLVGDRYNLHYGLSTPNQWSNCPWLTMNSAVLNSYRFKRMDEAIGLLSDVSEGDLSWVGGVYLENEPRYWDSDCEAGSPNSKRKVLWADFNPLVIADAKKDGVDLDPANGLSNEELSWLHRNVGRYNQDTADAARNAFASREIRNRPALYTHTLQHQKMFPGATINHAGSEWGLVSGGSTGIEGMKSTLTDFQRVREWGGWANVNREENDGYDIGWHLWDLRVAYCMGADFYNSYNWHAIGPQRVMDYMNQFTAELPVVTAKPASVRGIEPNCFRMKVPIRLQAFSRIELPVEVSRKIKGSAFLGITFADGRSFCSEREAVTLQPGSRTLALSFTTPAEINCQEEVLAVLYVFDDTGRMSLRPVMLDQSRAGEITLSLDMRLQRALSLAVINRARKNKTLP